MARTTPKSLAGSAAAAAKKVIASASATPVAATSAPKKKAVVNGTAKTTSAKAGSKTGTVKKTSPAAKAPVKKTASRTAAVKKAPVETTAVKKAPAAKKTPMKKMSVIADASATTTAATTTAATTPPAQTTPVKKVPVAKSAPTKSSPTTASSKAAPATKPPKKALASSLVVKEGEGSWTKAELDEVVAELHGQHEKLAHVIADAEAELAGLMKDAGDGAGHDQADMGATSFERDHELTVVNIERDMVAQIDKALARIDDGTYGVCEACGEPIGKMRLMAFPRATLCLPCKQREERR